jgi:protein phosphatase 1 regulatory subunit 37
VQLENDVINQALAVVAKLKRSSPTRSNSVSSLSASTPTVGDPVSDSAKTILLDLAAAIQATTDPLRLEELLEANDQLTAALAKTSSTSQLAERPTLTLHGLGLRTFDGARPLGDTAANGAALEEGVPNGNGQAMHGSAEEEDPEVSPNTPRIDKGKARAVPEPEQPQKVLSPTTFMIEESDEDDEDGSRFPVGDDIEVPMTSPTNRYVALFACLSVRLRVHFFALY